jgi:Protein of unknown function (DUF4238)
MSSRPKNHHFVAEMLLKRFTDESGKLYVFDKRRREKSVRVSSAKGDFFERDLNTFVQPNGTLDWSLETGYSKLEDSAELIVNRIVDAARKGQRPRLAFEEREIWFNFVYHQQKRAPDAFSRLGIDKDFPRQVHDRLVEFAGNVRQLTSDEWEFFSDPEEINRIKQRVLVGARSKGSKENVEALGSRGLMFATPKDSKKCFIIADHPIIRMGPRGRQHLADPMVELWFPIASDVAVSPWGETAAEELVYLDGDQVRQVNRAIYDQSNIVAGRSPLLIRSLAGI